MTDWKNQKIITNIESKPIVESNNKLDISKLKHPVHLYSHQNPGYFRRFYMLGFANAVAFSLLAFVLYKAEKERNENGRSKERSVAELTNGLLKDSDVPLISAGVAMVGFAALFRMHTITQTNLRSLVLSPPTTGNSSECTVKLKSCALVFPKTIIAPASSVFTREKLVSRIQEQAKSRPSGTAGRIWAQLKGENAKPLLIYTKNPSTKWKIDINGHVTNPSIFDSLFYKPFL